MRIVVVQSQQQSFQQRVDALVQGLSARFGATPAEQSWVREQMGQYADAPTLRWDNISAQFSELFEHARSTGTVLQGDHYDLLQAARKRRCDLEYQEILRARPSLAVYADMLPQEQMMLVAAVDMEMRGGIGIDELNWMVTEAAAGGDPVGLGRNDRANVDYWVALFSWARDTGFRLPGHRYRDVTEAKVQWEREQRKRQMVAEAPKVGKVVRRWRDGWKVVHVNYGSRGYLEQGDPVREAIEVEESVCDMRTQSYESEVYSVRDPTGMPMALFEMERGENSMTVLDYRGLSADAETRVKQWFDDMRVKGVVVYGPEIEGGDIADLQEGMDATGKFGMVARSPNFGGDVETYSENLKKAYDAGWPQHGSDWYRSAAFNALDVLLNYADDRMELLMVEKALEKFDEWSFDQFGDVEINFEHPYPQEDDYGSTAEYDEAMKEHERERDAAEEYFEPYVFSRRVYEELQGRMRRNDKFYGKEIERMEREWFERHVDEIADDAVSTVARMRDEERMRGESTMESIENLVEASGSSFKVVPAVRTR